MPLDIEKFCIYVGKAWIFQRVLFEGDIRTGRLWASTVGRIRRTARVGSFMRDGAAEECDADSIPVIIDRQPERTEQSRLKKMLMLLHKWLCLIL